MMQLQDMILQCLGRLTVDHCPLRCHSLPPNSVSWLVRTGTGMPKARRLPTQSASCPRHQSHVSYQQDCFPASVPSDLADLALREYAHLESPSFLLDGLETEHCQHSLLLTCPRRRRIVVVYHCG